MVHLTVYQVVAGCVVSVIQGYKWIEEQRPKVCIRYAFGVDVVALGNCRFINKKLQVRNDSTEGARKLVLLV